MTNKLDQILGEILNKKFNKRIHAGYDPDDVDSFFDYVISYLKDLNDQANKLLNQSNENAEEIKKLNGIIFQKNKTIEMLQQQIDQLQHEGYSNQRIQRFMSSLDDRVSSIEKKEKNS